MSEEQATQQAAKAAEEMPSAEVISQVLDAEILDSDGKPTTLRAVQQGRKLVVIFVRHWWCGVCQSYTRHISHCIPPDNVLSDTQIIFVGVGYPKPIAAWKEITGCTYPVYAHPTLAIHKLVEFNSQKKDLSITTYDKSFEQGLGTFWDHFKRVFWTGLWAHPDHLMSVGPFDQNGGEMVFEPDGTCSYIHRVTATDGHTEPKELADIIGAVFTPYKEGEAGGETLACDMGVKVA